MDANNEVQVFSAMTEGKTGQENNQIYVLPSAQHTNKNNNKEQLHILSPHFDINHSPSGDRQVKQLFATKPLKERQRKNYKFTNEQHKILSTYLDINHWPRKDSITDLSLKTNLTRTQVRQWFYRTLYKERQRNILSAALAYTFNNPPPTTLDLEECERITGQTKVTAVTAATVVTTASSGAADAALAVAAREREQCGQQQVPAAQQTIKDQQAEPALMQPHLDAQQPQQLHRHETMMLQHSSVGSRPPLSLIASASSDQPHQYLSMLQQHTDDRMLGGQQGQDNKANKQIFDHHSFITMPAAIINPTGGNSSNTSSSSFSIHQSMVLQEFLEKNSYPSENVVEYLSKLLLLSPRFIVEWFQSQSTSSPTQTSPMATGSSGGGAGPITATADDMMPAADNYTCQKCAMGFRRFLPMTRHERNCSNEDTNQRSVDALILSSVDSDSSLDVPGGGSDANIMPAGIITPAGSTSSHSSLSGERANRFTSDQIKVLQKFFENNSYPKDTDTEYLSQPFEVVEARVIMRHRD